MKSPHNAFWTPVMLARARELQATGLRPCEIDVVMGFRKATTAHKWAREAEKSIRKSRKRGELYIRADTCQVPADVLRDRDERWLAPRTVTQVMMGDPPLGWSALERCPQDEPKLGIHVKHRGLNARDNRGG